jgi:hypothetical protein
MLTLVIKTIELCNCNKPLASALKVMVANGILGFSPPSKESIFNDVPSD